MWNENNSPVGNRLELNVERDTRGSHIIMDICKKNNASIMQEEQR